MEQLHVVILERMCMNIIEQPTNAMYELSEVIVISGDSQDLHVGSSVMISCSASTLVNSTINWLSHDGSVVSSSGALILQSVNYTINGRMFTCSVNSPQLTNSINETITVTVQGKHDTNIMLKLLNILSLQQHQLVKSLLPTHHHMLLMVTRMLSCSVLSH